MNRRNWLRNAAGLLVAAPFVVKANSIMQVRPLLPNVSDAIGTLHFYNAKGGLLPDWRWVKTIPLPSLAALHLRYEWTPIVGTGLGTLQDF